MTTSANKVINDSWQKVSDGANSVQVVLGSVFVSYGDEPTEVQGHLISVSGHHEESISNGNVVGTWVRATRTDPQSIISVTEGS